ncbi:hypothetical protein C8Q76DRAFT_732994 [Earliella scabrosa]|nr:hypothetical protein C8Q76DRAFT_732994 [Earliella scabrosa]
MFRSFLLACRILCALDRPPLATFNYTHRSSPIPGARASCAQQCPLLFPRPAFVAQNDRGHVGGQPEGRTGRGDGQRWKKLEDKDEGEQIPGPYRCALAAFPFCSALPHFHVSSGDDVCRRLSMPAPNDILAML